MTEYEDETAVLFLKFGIMFTKIANTWEDSSDNFCKHLFQIMNFRNIFAGVYKFQFVIDDAFSIMISLRFHLPSTRKPWRTLGEAKYLKTQRYENRMF